MGLKGSGWVKTLLRTHPELQDCMHFASDSDARRNERPAGMRHVGKGVEPGFQVVIVELMLHKYVMLTGCQSTHQFFQRWKNLAADQIKRFPDAHTFVFLLDDETNVPQAKGKTQAERRKRGSGGFSPEELEALGPELSRLCNSRPAEFQQRLGQLFGEEASKRSVSPFEVFMTKHMQTSHLREDEFEFATRCILAGPYVLLGEGRRVIIDRGVWRSSFHRDLTTDEKKGDAEAWEHVLWSFRENLSTNHLGPEGPNPASRSWILMDQWGVRRLDGMEDQHLVGEADLKIPRYARLFSTQRIYVMCKDTDLIAILLMTVKDLVPTKSRCPTQLWLDVTVPSDNKRGQPPKRSVIDMVQLWRNLLRWFADEFTEISNPIEVFCCLLVMMGTDYLKNPASMGEKRIWGSFSKHLKARQCLAKAIWTDGLISGALPPDEATGQLLTQEYFAKVGSMQEASACAQAILMRDTTAGSIYDPKQQSKPGLSHCPKYHHTRHISFRESQIRQFVWEAYAIHGPKDRSKWPSYEWVTAFVRRVTWQLAYWYGGDTAEGRRWFDEMAVHPENGESIYGWRWTPNDDTQQAASKPETESEADHRPPKRKAGCLGRHRPRRMVSESTLQVVKISDFRSYHKTISTKKQKTA